MANNDRVVYADSSALVKLVITERETPDLQAHLSGPLTVASSRIALVEVPRAVTIAQPEDAGAAAEAERLLSRCLLLDLSETLLRDAARLASAEMRSLDAIHLASALRVAPDEMIVYDRRLQRAARSAGLAVAHPGAS